MSENLTPGVIGQMYQNRKRPDEIGVLESRDEKYKTLMFRDNEGKHFNIQYSTFRSNWRKYQGDAVIETSSQKEQDAMKEEVSVSQAKENLSDPKKKADKNSNDRRKISMSKEDLAKLIEDGALIIRESFKKANSSIFTLEQTYVKKSEQIRSTIRFGKTEIAEIWIVRSRFELGKVKFFMGEKPFSEAVFSQSVGKIEASKSTNPREKRPISFKISTDVLGPAVESLVKSLEPVYLDIQKQEQEKAEKKAKKVKEKKQDEI
jgi:hypothetical protein